MRIAGFFVLGLSVILNVMKWSEESLQSSFILFPIFEKTIHMKYLLLLLLTTSFCFAQEFKQDWKDFKVPSNWTMEFKNDTTPVLGKAPVGVLHFVNNESPKIIIVYYVFAKKYIDDSFREKIRKWYLVQSCVTKMGTHKALLSSFEKSYGYILKPCDNCNLSKNEDCGKLADAIFDFVSAKNKWTTLDN